MGCDIHWLLEARDPTGAWHAVHSKRYAQHLWEVHDGSYDGLFSTPDRVFGLRNYEWFGLLSGVRGDPLPEGPLLTEGLPCDISEHGADYLQDDFDLHSQRHIGVETLMGRLRQLEGDGTVDGDTREIVPRYLRMLEEFMAPGGLEAMMPAGQPLRILRGRTYCPETEVDFPEMQLSAHAALEDAGVIRALLPLRADRTRLVVAYDN